MLPSCSPISNLKIFLTQKMSLINLKNILLNAPKLQIPQICALHTTNICNKVQTARYKVTSKKNFPLTYEMANKPHDIAHRKSWNSWNTSNIEGGLRPSETAVEDVFIRKFMTGTWHDVFASEIIIKRQHNMIRIAGIIKQVISPRKVYFLIGYAEEMLSFWLQCPVKVELQSIADKNEMIFKYI